MVTQPFSIAADEVRAIAKDAYIYGFPLVDNYRVQYSFFEDRNNKEFKAPWNTLSNTARVYTADDKTIQTPNSDTPYSNVGVDLRTEPLVFSMPQVETDRYISVQFIDMYTHNFAYVGSRSTGNDAANYLLVGPNWQGEKPAGIKAVLQCETEFASVIYRTQLFRPDDLENVRKIQQGYQVQPLSQFLGQPAPPSAPAVEFIPPLTPEEERTSLEFFNILNFVLQFCPTHPSEAELRSRFAELGIEAGRPFDPEEISPEIREAINAGIADAWSIFAEGKNGIDTGKITSGELFGTREFLQQNYFYRMLAAALGIYGNSKEEAIYPIYAIDSNGEMLNGANKYRLRFSPVPPVRAFWSITLYEMPSCLLYANAIDRYLINSPMLPDLKKDPDGGVTLYIQHESPGGDLESNWLPAPSGPFSCVLRLYWPKPEAVSGAWQHPPLERE